MTYAFICLNLTKLTSTNSGNRFSKGLSRFLKRHSKIHQKYISTVAKFHLLEKLKIDFIAPREN